VFRVEVVVRVTEEGAQGIGCREFRSKQV
jgi:hypothetical protein